MFFKSFFEWKKKQFSNRKQKYLQKAKEWFADGYESDAEDLTNKIEELQEEIDKITLHYTKGGSALDNWTWWKIYCFWGKFSALDDSTKSIFRQLFETIFFVGGGVFLIKRFIFSPYAVPTGSAEPNLLVGDRLIGIRYPYLFSEPKRGDLIIFDEPGFEYSKNIFAKIYQKYIGFGFMGILPKGPAAWTKRLIGIPGDRIALKMNENGKAEVWRNGELLEEPYVNPYPVISLKRKKGLIDPRSNLLKMPLIGSFIEFFDLVKGYQDGGTNIGNMLFTYDPEKPYDNQPFYQFEKTEINRHPFSGKSIIFYPDKGSPRLDIKPEFTVPQGYLFAMGDSRKNSDDCRRFGLINRSLVVGRASFIFFSLDGAETFWITEFIKNPITFFTKKIRWKRFFRSVHPFTSIPNS